MLVIKGSESIGLRLATQESAVNFCFSKEAELIPSAQPGKTESKSKYQRLLHLMSAHKNKNIAMQCFKL